MNGLTRVGALVTLSVAVAAPTTAQAGTGGSDLVPYKASLLAHATLNVQTGAVHAVGTGEATHLGSWTLDEHGVAVPTGPGTFAYSSTYVITAADGAELFGVIVGTGSTTDGVHFTFVVDGQSTGGSGRLADATITQHAVIHLTVESVDGATIAGPAQGAVVGTFSH
jgi:hypothetical protein